MDRPICFITGTSSGFGLLTTIEMAKEGYTVIATMRNLQKKTLLVEEIERAGLSEFIHIIQLDVTNHNSIKEVIQTTIEKYDRIDVLINNAGYAFGSFIEEMKMEELREQFETNFFGLVALTKEVIPHMRQSRNGTIVNMSSISGHFGFPALGAYASSKFAVEGFSESLRFELLPFGIKVVLIEPGSYRTDIWTKGFSGIKVNETSPYAAYKSKMFQVVEHIEENAQNPLEVAETIVQAVKNPNPPLRYPVGRAIKTQIKWKNIIPWKWLEKQVSKKILK
ncbi:MULTISPECIES: SDR family oxidoreductase [Sutcliffiella]|uniref:Short-chain dehydrogenase n=1 Tax=Sutcliffiella cohnii TaxID=33932 RepID=A0A223KQ71_9BACI|nr:MULTISPECIES: SDR family oxidoreductase [Sutcliffiella]AST91665.1 short-chain dehydrogenase [Sutcliffiella cohnii]MED4014746.1 SDR family oxidoreductase [Sutcliffiella cohnii]WBL12888.1 SDR family oxidoreductase [Sutcliffiella sp. NC1]